MANSGPDTNKVNSPNPLRPDLTRRQAQFFITYAKQAHLDGKYTIFGRVIDGADSTLDAMESVPVGSKNKPLQEIRTKEVSLCLNLGRS
jgi:peptidyl-prolyl cis-trans isomerase-like 3